MVEEGFFRILVKVALALFNFQVLLWEALEYFEFLPLPFFRDIDELLEGDAPIVDGDEERQEIESSFVDVAFTLISDPSERG